MQGVGAAQLALPFGALFGQKVATMRVVAFEAARRRFLETFRGATIGFQFRHSISPDFRYTALPTGGPETIPLGGWELDDPIRPVHLARVKTPV